MLASANYVASPRKRVRTVRYNKEAAGAYGVRPRGLSGGAQGTLAQFQSVAPIAGTLAYLIRLFLQRGLFVSTARRFFEVLCSLVRLAAAQRLWERVLGDNASAVSVTSVSGVSQFAAQPHFWD